MSTIFKVFIQFIILLLLYILIFLAYEILTPQPGIEPSVPALEGEVLTTGLPEKSHELIEI